MHSKAQQTHPSQATVQCKDKKITRDESIYKEEKIMAIKFEFPLQWPVQQPRTKHQMRAQFGKHSPSKAGNYLVNDLSMMQARQCIITSNLQLRKDNSGFYANQRVEDPAIAVFFTLKGVPKVMACDKWDRPEHNIWALYLSVAAIRGLERWGGSEFLDGLFTGFRALPCPDDVIVREYDYFAGVTEEWQLKKKYKEFCKLLHPDINPNMKEDFVIMQKQYEQRRKR